MIDLINYQFLKRKYNIDLNFRKNIIKRTICKHDYYYYKLPKKINMLSSSARKEAVICSECGKVKKFVNVYW